MDRLTGMDESASYELHWNRAKHSNQDRTNAEIERNQTHNQEGYPATLHRSPTGHAHRMSNFHRRRSSSSLQASSSSTAVVKRRPGRPAKKHKTSSVSTVVKQENQVAEEYDDDNDADTDNSASSPLPPLVPLHRFSIKPESSSAAATSSTSEGEDESKSPVRSTSPDMPSRTGNAQSMSGRTSNVRKSGRPSGPIASPTTAVPTSELAALIANINHAWKHLEYNMMHRPLRADEMKVQSASSSSPLANRKPTLPSTLTSSNDSDTAAPIEPMNTEPSIIKAPPNGSLSSSIVANLSKATLDSEERRELLEHVKLLAEKRKREGKSVANLKCSRVGPRYQAKITTVLPPPLTPELLQTIRDEPYDYERFARDEFPVQMGDYDLQVQLMKVSSIGAPAYPLDDRFRVRISSFINRRRERKRKEEERRAQQSVSQQIQEARSGFSFHALDATAGRKSSTVNHAAVSNGRPSSPPVDPLASYGSVVFKDVTDNGEGGESLESKRRSSRITPSLVVKQYAKPVATKPSASAISPTTSGSDPINSGLPAELDYQFSQVADKRSAREQAEADRRLAEKLQAYYEREHSTGKVGRKVRRDLGAKRGPKPQKSHNPTLPVDSAIASTTPNAATTTPPNATAPAAAANAVSSILPSASLSVASLFPTNVQYPPSSLSSLSAPNSTSPMGSRVASAHSSPHLSGQKRKRSPSPIVSGKVPSSTSSPSLLSTPPLNPIKRIVAPSEEQQRQVNAALHHHTLSSLDSIHILPPTSAASKQHFDEHKSSLPPTPPVAPISSGKKPGRPPKSATLNASAAAAAAAAHALANEILLQAIYKQKSHATTDYVSHTPAAAINLPTSATSSSTDASAATQKSVSIPVLPPMNPALEASAATSSAPLRDIPQYAFSKPAKTVGAKLTAAALAARDDSKKRVASIAAVSGIADAVAGSKRGKGFF